VEKETIDGDELREVLEQHMPGPKLVPGSLPRPSDVEPPAQEWRPESKGAGG
jgi:hypothetical protein